MPLLSFCLIIICSALFFSRESINVPWEQLVDMLCFHRDLAALSALSQINIEQGQWYNMQKHGLSLSSQQLYKTQVDIILQHSLTASSLTGAKIYRAKKRLVYNQTCVFVLFMSSINMHMCLWKLLHKFHQHGMLESGILFIFCVLTWFQISKTSF